MKVTCEIEYTEVLNENDVLVDGVVVTCDRCGHSEESFGQGEKSVLRCCALLRENCPEEEENYYIAE